MPNVTIPSNPEDKKRIKNALQEISDSFTRIAAERDAIKDVINFVNEEFELPKKYVRKMAKVYHAQNFDQEVGEAEDFAVLYENITGQTTADNK